MKLAYLFRLVLIGHVLSAPTSFASTQSYRPTCTYRYTQQAVPINGHNTTVEYYVPDTRGTHPLVFMLHGSAGAYSLTSTREPLLDNFGERRLAQSCFVVVLPHYLEAFGSKSMTDEGAMTSMFPQLMSVVDILLRSAESLPSTKGKPVFLFGESLGGYLSIALGLRRGEVAAVSEISGGLPLGYAIHDPHRVAVLISHGADDRLVPAQSAADLKQYCLNHLLRVDMNLYPGVGHYMPREVEAKCITATITFFLSQSPKVPFR